MDGAVREIHWQFLVPVQDLDQPMVCRIAPGEQHPVTRLQGGRLVPCNGIEAPYFFGMSMSMAFSGVPPIPTEIC